MSTQTYSSGGIGLGTILFVVFLILKLTHVIDWSWWWITAPLWIPFCLGVLIFLKGMIVTIIVAWLASK